MIVVVRRSQTREQQCQRISSFLSPVACQIFENKFLAKQYEFDCQNSNHFHCKQKFRPIPTFQIEWWYLKLPLSRLLLHQFCGNYLPGEFCICGMVKSLDERLLNLQSITFCALVLLNPLKPHLKFRFAVFYISMNCQM